jgi:hypothetical protein
MRLVLAEQRDLFSGVPAAPITYASLPPFADPGPLPKGAGKMLGKSERRIASTLPYHTAYSPPEAREESRDVTVSGPHRYFLQESAERARHFELIDRKSAEVIDSGPWLNVWGQAIRRNGISLGRVEQ